MSDSIRRQHVCFLFSAADVLDDVWGARVSMMLSRAAVVTVKRT